jgi:hypothetical protein
VWWCKRTILRQRFRFLPEAIQNIVHYCPRPLEFWSERWLLSADGIEYVLQHSTLARTAFAASRDYIVVQGGTVVCDERSGDSKTRLNEEDRYLSSITTVLVRILSRLEYLGFVHVQLFVRFK